MSALEWFVLLFLCYAVLMLFWAFKQSRQFVEGSNQNAALLSALSPWQQNSLLAVFLMGSGAFILVPSVVFQYGLWGLVWVGIILFLLFLLWVFTRFVFKARNYRASQALQKPSFIQGIKSLLLLVGAIFLISWQFRTVLGFMGSLGTVSIVQTVVLLGLSLLLLVSVSLANEKALSYLNNIKLLALILCCGAVSFILYAYIGGGRASAHHLTEFYQFSDLSLPGMLRSALHIPKAQLSLVELYSFIAISFSLIVLLLVGELSKEMSQSLSESDYKKESRRLVSKLGVALAFGLVILLFICYFLLLGYGAHFTGADTAYNLRFSEKIMVLFDPLAASAVYPNLITSLLESLAPILPFVVAFFTVIISAILLSSSQIILFLVGRMVSGNLVKPVLAVFGSTNVTDKASDLITQRRVYALILMAVMVFSQI